MTEIHITDKVIIYNDMPRGWREGKGQPKWHKKVYDMWRDRWRRCKDPNSKDYEYYKDCEIYEDFKYLSKFVAWIMNEPLFKEFCTTCDKIKWCIDKDMKDPNNRNYYPEYMSLIKDKDNIIDRNNRNGNPIPKIPCIGINKNSIILLKSCSDGKSKGFRATHISTCLRKNKKLHKGYRWYKINYKHGRRYRIKRGEF